MVTDQTIIWRRLDTPGHESARMFLLDSSWHLSGTAVFVHERQPCRLDYLLRCDLQWQTSSAKVAGWVGNKMIDIEVLVDANRRWSLNGEECVEVNGCIDLDLNFSPITNLLPIRRLNLAVRQQVTVTAAWLSFPSFRFEQLEQMYRRVGVSSYYYESAGGSFVADLDVNDVGFVTRYGDLWKVENSG